jgi:hypothetical protein
MFPLVPDRYHPLAEARMGLRARVSGVDDLIEAVPEAFATIRASPSSVSSGASARVSGTRPAS